MSDMRVVLFDRFLVEVVNVSMYKNSKLIINKNNNVSISSKRLYSTRAHSFDLENVTTTLPESVISENIIHKIDFKSVEIEKLQHPSLEQDKKPSIKPITYNKSKTSDFCTVDIETIIMDDSNIHIPIAISTYCKNFKQLFLIDDKLLKKDSDKAVKQLFKDYLDFMIKQNKSYTIFAHNNGGYDGYFFFKNFLTIVDNIDDLTCLVDESNKFITIEYDFVNSDEEFYTLTWKDSLRIFPGKLDSICKQFGVKGKLSEYDPLFNNIKLFENKKLLEKFKEYSLQDSIALYEALINAQELYFNKYGVDICDVVSTASLSFKIFRKDFLKKEIPLLTNSEDNFVRDAYLGGATDFYMAEGENIYWYDVNSLYPYAMLEPVPYKIIDKHNDLSSVKVSDFKGFVKAKVTCPENIVNPIVACKHEGRTIYPRGSWIGTYFADYLAKAETYGYKIELISGIEFEYIDLFSSYIKHFYEIKKNSTGSLKYLAKLKLNSLYGMFGRRPDNKNVINIKTEDFPDYLNTHIIDNHIDYGNGFSTIIIHSEPDYDLISKLNCELESSFKPLEKPVYANVAIAAAITARAQMIMMDYKNNSDFIVYYTDTDSIFTNKPLPKCLIGNELGQMKNETLDKYGVECIDKACFVGLKKYGLVVTDNKGVKHELSTFSGVPKNELNFDEVIKIHNGQSITRNLKDRFYKSFDNLTIKTQTNVKLEISNKRDKLLIDNSYIPIILSCPDVIDRKSGHFKSIVKRQNRFSKSISK
jgi:hypothetical protein